MPSRWVRSEEGLHGLGAALGPVAFSQVPWIECDLWDGVNLIPLIINSIKMKGKPLWLELVHAMHQSYCTWTNHLVILIYGVVGIFWALFRGAPGYQDGASLHPHILFVVCLLTGQLVVLWPTWYCCVDCSFFQHPGNWHDMISCWKELVFIRHTPVVLEIRFKFFLFVLAHKLLIRS